MPRFDPWQNRPDRPAIAVPPPPAGDLRHLLIWAAIVMVPVVSYAYHIRLLF